MQITDYLVYASPAVLLSAILILIYAIRLSRSARMSQNYMADSFRHSIEKRISELSQQLSYSTARFDSINHLLLDAQKALKDQPYQPFAVKADFFSQQGIQLKGPIDDSLIFVLMPFNPEQEKTYKVIKNTIESLGFVCRRGDEDFVSSNVLTHILKQLVRARFIIADITGRNPNVFYELGIAHALGKPVLLLSKNPGDISFDVSITRVLIYNDLNNLEITLKSWFVHSLASVR